MTDQEKSVSAAGADPDAAIRAAKHQLAAADTTGDDHARGQLDRAGKARALVAERNSALPDRVAAIDKELDGLGFGAPLASTAAQRGDAAPAGRATRQERQATAAPKAGAAKAEQSSASSKSEPGKG